MLKKILLFTCIVILASSGCAFQSNGPEKESSFDGVSKIYPWVDPYIAANAVDYISGMYDPRQTAISLKTDTPFGIALEKALLRRGFVIFKGGLPVTYTFDMINQGSCYLSLQTPDGAITQAYYVNNGQVAAYPNTIKTGFFNADTPPPASSQASLPALAVTRPGQQYPNQYFAETAPNGLLYPMPDRSSASPAQINPSRMSMPAPPIPSVTSVPEVISVPSWKLTPGPLRAQLEEWGKRAGYQIAWKAAHDFELSAGSQFEGEFVDVVQNLILRLHEQGNPLKVAIYLGNQVVEVLEE